MNILGIETSCDETAISIVQDGRTVLYNGLRSSMKEFLEAGGVIPEQAARKQLEYMPVLLKEALETDIHFDAIAVTESPGLQSSLLVGRTTAHTLGVVHNVPVFLINHTQGHLASVFLDTDFTIEFPVLTLSLSGGHTELWLRTGHSEGTLLGTTQDDAIGEAFDKGANLLGLPYPGGPAIAHCAQNGNPLAYQFPLPLQGKPGLHFSYSGLKTALRNVIATLNVQNEQIKADVCASYEHALCNHITDRLHKALKQHSVAQVHLVGGVAANKHLRLQVQQTCTNVPVYWPTKLEYCTDNAAMIAGAAYFNKQFTVP